MMDTENTGAADEGSSNPAQRLKRQVATAVRTTIVGMEAEVHAALVTIVAGGHVLLEGPPGVAKTMLVRSIARALGGDFGRVQFTPDLMPADVTGTSVFHPTRGVFEFQPGPIFANVLLCDEINRAPAKTQSALLEAMQESSVTVDGKRHALPEPFTVFATMNPIEHEGTYPLPEAQLDRFLLKVLVAYPTPEREAELMTRAHVRALNASPESLGVPVVTSMHEVQSAREYARSVVVREDLPPYVVRILRATRADRAIVMGASPRAGVMLLSAAKAHAALEGRDYVTPDDVKLMCLPALRHRVLLDPAEEIEGTTSDDVLRRILDAVEVPR